MTGRSEGVTNVRQTASAGAAAVPALRQQSSCHTVSAGLLSCSWGEQQQGTAPTHTAPAHLGLGIAYWGEYRESIGIK